MQSSSHAAYYPSEESSLVSKYFMFLLNILMLFLISIIIYFNLIIKLTCFNSFS